MNETGTLQKIAERSLITQGWCSARRDRTSLVSSRRPTIVDVAAAAGVSKSLVSLALRNAPGVSAATRARIMAIADDLGYRSHTWARALAAGRSQVIGILLNDLHSAYHTDIVEGIERAADAAGLTTVLSHGQRDPKVLAQRLGHLQDLSVDGVIVVSALLSPDVLAHAARRGPVVVVGRTAQVADAVGAVWNNDEVGAHLAVEHLARLGHTRIAHLAGSHRPASQARRAAFHSTMTALDLPAPHLVCDDTDTVIASVRAGATTAVFASNDTRAARLVGAALDAGLRVPEDLGVVGYDNTELTELLRPRLTSVDQPRHEMGQRALAILTDLLGGSPARVEVVAPRLIVRDSSGPSPTA